MKIHLSETEFLKAELKRLQNDMQALAAQPAPVEPDWKAEYLKSVESGCITLDELRETLAELDATDRQVEILSDALAESRREVAALKAVQEPVALIDRLINPEQHYEFIDPKKANAVLMSLCQEAADALAAPVQEPVTCYCCHSCFKASSGMMLDRMILCSECGNKRCPKASDHRLDCTSSNDPGQPGSVYTTPPAAPVQEPVTMPENWSAGMLKEYQKKALGITTPPAAQQEPYKGMSEHLAQATNGRVYVDSVTGDVGIGTPAAPVQEPVAWRWSESKGERWFDWTTDWSHHDKAKLMAFPIEYAYTTPPAAKRQWVGLTDDEILKLAYPIRWQEVDDFEADKAVNFAQAIEAKLKEKNNG
jgi:hypothetical protein